MLAEIVKDVGDTIMVIQAHDRGEGIVQVMWRCGHISGSCLMPGVVWNAINENAQDVFLDVLKKRGFRFADLPH